MTLLRPLLLATLGLAGCLSDPELPAGDWDYGPKEMLFETEIGRVTTQFFTITNSRNEGLKLVISRPTPDGDCPEEPFLQPPREIRISANSSQEIAITHAPQQLPESGTCSYLLYISQKDEEGTGRRAVRLSGTVKDIDADFDGWGRGEGDCLDRPEIPDSALINPGAQEICDGKDNDCDGLFDDDDDNEVDKWNRYPELLPADVDGNPILPDPLIGGRQLFFPDNDQDFYPRELGGAEFCVPPIGWLLPPDATQATENNGGWDCNDQLPDIFPGAFELPGEGVDRDCDDAYSCYEDLDDDRFGNIAVVIAHPESLNDPFCREPLVSDNAADCDDLSDQINPNRVELCNQIDDDCDGLIDDADPSVFDRSVWFYDGDNDNEGIAAISTLACVQPLSYVANALDCNDSNPNINSTANEVCDGVDNDCNGIPDDDPVDPLAWFVDVDGDGYGDRSVPRPATLNDPIPGGFRWSCNQPLGYSLQNTDCNDGSSLESPGSAEVTGDGVDQNCDGLEACYVDEDGDTFGTNRVVSVADANASQAGYQCGAGTSSRAGDCNDTIDPTDVLYPGTAAAPGLEEVCDGIDNDCDNKIDDADETLNVNLQWLRDADGDGFGNPGLVVFACDAPAGFVAYNPAADPVDCNDNDASARPGGTEVPADGIDGDCNGSEDCYNDADNDGYGTAALVQGNFRCSDQGASTFDTDCDDTPGVGFTRSPIAFERCDTGLIDEDCDGLIDDLDPNVIGRAVYYLDADGDTWGNVNVSIERCAVPTSYVATPGDCNDTTSQVAPGRAELCNSVDDDCDGFLDDADSDLDPSNPSSGALVWYRDRDNDGYGTNSDTRTQCNPPVGYVASSGDCDDQIRETNPGAGEVIGDGVDKNCDGRELCYVDNDADEWGSSTVVEVSATGTCVNPGVSSSRTGDCLDSNATVAPAKPEVCDGIDNDCDFLTDDADDDVQPERNDLRLRWQRDADNDGYGDAGNTTLACDQPPGYESYYVNRDAAVPVAAPADCDDANFNINPAADEQPADDIDQNCNGQESCYRDADGDGYGTSTETSEQAGDPLCRANGRSGRDDDCDDSALGVFPGAVEVCNGRVDDDCDGLSDDLDSSLLDGVLWFRDGDNDGFGNASISLRRCVAPNQYVINALDCNDLRANVSPAAPELCDSLDIDNDCDGAADDLDPDINYALPGVNARLWYPDADGDGYGESDDNNDGLGDLSGEVLRLGCDASLQEVPNDQDCNDNNAAIRPGAVETAGNQIDQNCDDAEDCYLDNDRDGFGDPSVIVSVSAPGWCSIAGYATRGNDCDDSNPSARDSQTLYFYDADGDGYGNVNASRLECGDPGVEWVENASDCDDGRNFVNPLALERCDAANLDENCNGLVEDIDRIAAAPGTFDNSSRSSFYPDADNDGFGSSTAPAILACDAGRNQVADQSDCNDGNLEIRPGVVEIPGDNVDQNCDRAEDCYVDADDDDWGAATVRSVPAFFPTFSTCGSFTNRADRTGDCNDTTNTISPVAVETCNDLDDDCDRQIDDADDGLVADESDPAETWWFDADGDGYGNPDFAVYQCDRPVGFVPWPRNATTGAYLSAAAAAALADCEDADFTVRPGATETPGDRRDQNCDGDELCYVDNDNDGVGSNTTVAAPGFFTNGTGSCTDLGEANLPGDCNDNNAAETTSGGASFFDSDGDGYGDPNNSFLGCNAPTGYVGNSSDCDDLDFDVKPGGNEVLCDGADSDCDGLVDEEADFDIYFFDSDLDGYGTVLVTTFACQDPGAIWVTQPGDCDDLNDDVSPDAADNNCDGVDDNCDAVPDDESTFSFWYFDSDNDTYGNDNTALYLCAAPPGQWRATGRDCDDALATVNPAATDNTCNDRDDNCDGRIDEAGGTNWYADADGDGAGAISGLATLACDAPPGFVATRTDCNDTTPLVSPTGTEVCDGLDNDCAGGIDNGTTIGPSWWLDTDGDGFGAGTSVRACNAPAGRVDNEDDCAAAEPTVYPGAPERCNAVDDDCDGLVDFGAPCGGTWFEGTNRVYVAADQPTPWPAALSYCDAIGYQLVWLETVAERDLVDAFASGSIGGQYWAGYSFGDCGGADDEWARAVLGDLCSVTPTVASEPTVDPSNGRTAGRRDNGAWVGDEPTDEFPFVCEAVVPP